MIKHLIWIIPVIAMIWFIIYNYKEYNNFEVGVTLGLGVISMLVSLLCTTALTLIIDDCADKEFIKATEYEIYSLKDNSSIEGRKYLMSGYINEQMVYRAFIDKEEGKAIKEFSSDKSIICEDNSNFVEVYSLKHTNPFISKLLGFEVSKEEAKYIIHIPKGSIVTEYELDLE